MASEKLDWAEIIADLESKRAALDGLIGSFRAALALGALGQPGDIDLAALGAGPRPAAASGAPIELPTGAFLGKSLPAAIKLYLSAVRRKQTIREIATALKDGGVESTSDNFENIVTGALNRLKAAGDVLRFKDGWALAEFYPESLRNRISQGEAKARPAKKGKGKTKSPTTKKPTRPVKAKREGPSIDDRVLTLLRTEAANAGTLTAKLSAPSNVIGLALGRLKHKGKVEKTPEGMYALRTEAILRAV